MRLEAHSSDLSERRKRWWSGAGGTYRTSRRCAAHLGLRASRPPSERVSQTVPRIDAGPILAQRRIDVHGNETAGTLGKRLVEEGLIALDDTLARLQADLATVHRAFELGTPTLSIRDYAASGGSVLATGSPDEVRTDPLVVAAYLGGPAAAATRRPRGAVPGSRPRARCGTARSRTSPRPTATSSSWATTEALRLTRRRPPPG